MIAILSFHQSLRRSRRLDVPDTAILERVAAFLGPVLRQFQPGQRQHRGGVLFGIVCFRAAFENLAKGVVQRFPSISLQRHGTLVYPVKHSVTY